MRIEIRQSVAVPRRLLWNLLVDWERQPEWMVDAEEVHVLTPQRTGVGVTLRCPTRLLGATVQDVMRVTGWQEPSHLEVVHLGRIITGRGAFELVEQDAQSTTVTWHEQIDPPLGRLGEWAASCLVSPIVRRVFARSLRNLSELAEREVGSDDRPTGETLSRRSSGYRARPPRSCGTGRARPGPV